MKEKVNSIIEILKARYADAPCALHYEKDYELMIAVRLSAQCTDARVNLVTPALFAAYPTLEAMATADIADVENYVHSCGFYKHKARDIVLACQMLLTDYDGKVPSTMEQLLRLPGVGRKTADVMIAVAFLGDAIPVDTHVFRVSNRIGLANAKTPYKTELQLMKTIEKNEWSTAHHLILWHGRLVCKARSPKCIDCKIKDYCKYYNKVKKDDN